MPPSPVSPTDPASWPDFPPEEKRSPPAHNSSRLGIGLLLLLLAGLVGTLLLIRYGSGSILLPPLPGEPDGPLGTDRVPGQPIEYADQELKTMDYGAVNGIYAQALGRAEGRSAAVPPAPPGWRGGKPGSGARLEARQVVRPEAAQRRPDERSAQNGYEEALLRAGFNTTRQDPPPDAEVLPPALLPAVVSGQQSVRTGARVQFRTLDSSRIAGRFIPAGSLLIGYARLGAERLLLTGTSLYLPSGQVLSVRLKALDRDRNEGLALLSSPAQRRQLEQGASRGLHQLLGRASSSAGYALDQATGQRGVRHWPAWEPVCRPPPPAPTGGRWYFPMDARFTLSPKNHEHAKTPPGRAAGGPAGPVARPRP